MVFLKEFSPLYNLQQKIRTDKFKLKKQSTCVRKMLHAKLRF